MTIGDFRASDHYQGWLEKVKESDLIKILNPKDKTVFTTEPGANKKEIKVSGTLEAKQKGKVMVIIRTDRDYPQAIGEAKQGKWELYGCTLGGVDHLIYAVFIDENDKPLFRSKTINIRLEQSSMLK